MTVGVEQIVEVVPGRHVRAVTAEREIVAVEGKVLRRCQPVADAIAAGARFDAGAVAGPHQSVRAEATGIAPSGAQLRTAGVRSVSHVVARRLARASMALLEDGATGAAIDLAVVFGTPAAEIDAGVVL